MEHFYENIMFVAESSNAINVLSGQKLRLPFETTKKIDNSAVRCTTALNLYVSDFAMLRIANDTLCIRI